MVYIYSPLHEWQARLDFTAMDEFSYIDHDWILVDGRE
jgi:hypothetical protein